jgi:hypothetical protein
MTRRSLHLIVLVVTLLTACTPKAPATPTVDAVGTRVAELAAIMMTQTAAAYSPTPLPSPTFTATPAFTETPTLEPTPATTSIPKVTGSVGYAPCYKGGPGAPYGLDSNITDTKEVEVVGIGSVPGWYVIINPYFYTQCWIAAENLVLDPNFNAAAFPTITP